jgi:hypothetical protein
MSATRTGAAKVILQRGMCLLHWDEAERGYIIVAWNEDGGLLDLVPTWGERSIPV